MSVNKCVRACVPCASVRLNLYACAYKEFHAFMPAVSKFLVDFHAN